MTFKSLHNCKGYGLLLKIDRKTLEVENRLFARVLVDIYLANSLPDKVLVKREGLNFFVSIQYVNLPTFCGRCFSIGHSATMCRKGVEERTQNKENSREAVSHQSEGVLVYGYLE